MGAAGDGRVSAASRADYAAAAAAVLIGDGHDNAVYELGGPAFSLKELATEIAELSGTDVVYQDLSVAELTEVLVGAGLDEATAGFVAALDEAVARGDLYTSSSDLARLIGRPATPLADVIRTALASPVAASGPPDAERPSVPARWRGTDGRSGVGMAGRGQLAAAVLSWLTNASAVCAPESTSSEVSSRWSATSWVVRSK